MRIEEVRLRNFRSYGNNTITISFTSGLNVLLGRIGSGKSSILEAILICLFGFGRSGIRKSDILRRDATADDLQIELTFFFDGMHFKVLRGNETRLETSPDGMSWTLVSENSREIDEYIEKTLDSSARKFRDLFYAAQGELTNVITGSSEERQKSIDKLLGAEGLRETYERLTEFAKYYDKDIGTAEGKVTDIEAYLKRNDLDRMRDEKRAAEQEVIEVGQRIESMAKEISGLNEQLDALLSRAKPLEEADAKLRQKLRFISEKESELKNKEFQIGEMEKRLKHLADQQYRNKEKLEKFGPQRKEIEETFNEKDALHKRLSGLRAEAIGLTERLSGITDNVETLKELIAKDKERELEIASQVRDSERRIADLISERGRKEEEINIAERRLKEQSEELSTRNEELRQAELGVNTLQAKARENAEKITKLSSLTEGAKCPFCEQPITSAHRTAVVGRIESVIKQLLREEKEAKSFADRARKRRDELTSSIESTRTELQGLRESISRINEMVAREEQSGVHLAKGLEECVAHRSQCEKNLEAETKQLEKYNSKLDSIKAASGVDLKDWPKGLEKAIDEVDKERHEAQRRLSKITGEIQSAKSLLAEAVEEARSREATLKELVQSVSSLVQDLARAREETTQIYEPLIGRTEDPQAKLTEMISEIQSQLQEVRDRLKEREITKVSLSSQYRQKEDQIAQLAQQIEEYLGEQERKMLIKRTLTIYSEAKNLLQQIRDKYKDAREMIRTNLINVLRETLRVEFDRLYAYEDFHDVQVSDDYEVSLQSPIGEIQAHNLSAGQKAIVSIAFRIAVAKAMEMKIGCWIIDEPTQNIGKAEVEALADVLADTSEIPQIIVASHHEALGRHGNVVSLGIRHSETVLGEGSQPLHTKPVLARQLKQVPTETPGEGVPEPAEEATAEPEDVPTPPATR